MLYILYMSKKTMSEVLNELENINPFPSKNPIKDKTRMNVVGGKEEAKKEKVIEAFTLGMTRAYDKKHLVPSVNNRNPKLQQLHILLKKLMKERDPTYKYTTIQINKNVETDWHEDKNNIGKSYCLSLGNFTGGALELKTEKGIVSLPTKNKMVFYDGNIEHRTGDYKGTRYAIIWFKRK
jgi:hypothetical protein